MKNWLIFDDFIEGEVWVDIPSLTGRYQASSKGRLRSLVYRYDKKRKTPKIIKQFLTRSGYCRCCLVSGSDNEYKKIYKFVHRLVAESFIPNDKNLLTVNHKNLDKEDNSIENLEWLSYEDNNIHAWQNGVFDDKVKLSDSDVIDIYNSNEHWVEVSKKYNISYTTICSIRGCRNRINVVGGMANKNNKIISNSDAIKIYNSFGSTNEIANIFNIKQSTVWRIKSGRAFGGVTGHLGITSITKQTNLSNQDILNIYNSTEPIKTILKKFKISFKRYKKIKSSELYSHITSKQ